MLLLLLLLLFRCTPLPGRPPLALLLLRVWP
jgi:hypothetical protein